MEGINNPAAMEKYLDWLDELEKNDPEQYKVLIQQMQAQMIKDADGKSPDLDQFAATIAANTMNDSGEDFQPKFPGNKVMGPDGIDKQEEGMMIDVEPAFVMKTDDGATKVFINFCHSEKIREFSMQKKLDAEGKEQEGISVPLSLGPPRQVSDKAGKPAIAFDVAVNSKVINDCREDKTGTFRNFLCELAIEYVFQKYKKQLNSRYKLPRSTYHGTLPPPQHRIRVSQAPVIEEITESKATTQGPQSKAGQEKPKPKKRLGPLETLTFTMLQTCSDAEPEPCTRIAAVEGGSPLTQELLNACPERLVITVDLAKAESIQDVQVELAAEYTIIKAAGCRALEIFLPYPVNEQISTCSIDSNIKKLMLTMPIDRKFNNDRPDPGSNAWMLAQALDIGESSETKDARPKPAHDRFHLNENPEKIHDSKSKFDPVAEDEVLPEDRFHAKDIMSQHLLEQRRRDKEEKIRSTEQLRKERKAEADRKRAAAEAAGKTWEEMYPNDPETTFIDLEELTQQQRKENEKNHAEVDKLEFVPTEEALAAVASWSKRQEDLGLKLSSSLAFELL